MLKSHKLTHEEAEVLLKEAFDLTFERYAKYRCFVLNHHFDNIDKVSDAYDAKQLMSLVAQSMRIQGWNHYFPITGERASELLYHILDTDLPRSIPIMELFESGIGLEYKDSINFDLHHIIKQHASFVLITKLI